MLCIEQVRQRFGDLLVAANLLFAGRQVRSSPLYTASHFRLRLGRLLRRRTMHGIGSLGRLLGLLQGRGSARVDVRRLLSQLPGVPTFLRQLLACLGGKGLGGFLQLLRSLGQGVIHGLLCFARTLGITLV